MASPSPFPSSVQVKLLQIREQIQNEHKQREKDNLFNPMVSPGPASIALLDSKRDASVSNSNKKRKTAGTADSDVSSRRGFFAAAALNAAVTRPLPMKKGKAYIATPGSKRSVSVTSDDSSIESSSPNTWGVKDNYIVGKNDNVITCLCGINKKVDNSQISNNDGVIQCNHCNRWQHLKCYSLKQRFDVVPVKFFCNKCKPGLSQDSYRINKRVRPLQQRQQQSNLKELERQLQLQIQNQINLNILNQTSDKTTSNNSVYQNMTPSPGELVSTDDSKSTPLSPLGSENKTSPCGSPSSLVSDSTLKCHTGESALESYQYQDKYIKSFVDDHSNDDWVIPINRGLVIAPDALEARKLDDLTIGVFATKDFKCKEFVTEFTGKVDFQKNYIKNPDNQYRIWATTQPQVIFHPHWPILIDARGESDANPIKSIRRGCHPNVEMNTVKITSPTTNKAEVYFMINAIRDIKAGEELLIAWQWDLRHPISRVLNNQYAIESMNDMDRLWLIHAIDIIWKTCRCGCSADAECKLLRIKNYAESFLDHLKKMKHVNA
ncbi:hypothetical protein DAKH74_008720 [Maudiozyma humilis]|uniref:SET domain-containing protein n=1 Tax=Maudiozyma humilis TaxID=51915 RepID=A0AAV5RRV6_MAUHU|nr:hypothetical protein DAKH74_008720 [Kazachstania humilis]